MSLPRVLRLGAAVALATPAALVAEPAAAVTPAVPTAVCGVVLGTGLTRANDISDGGLIVGDDARPRAVSRDWRTGTYRYYGGIEGGLPSAMTAASSGGVVAGVAAVDGPSLDPSKAVRIEGRLPLVPINRSRTTHDQVADVNDANTVVGNSEILGAGGRTEAFVWTDRRHVLNGPVPTYWRVQALKVNEAGWVLGSGYRPDAGGILRFRTLVWRPDRTAIELPALPDGASFNPAHLTEDGTVIGHRTTQDGVGDALMTWSAAAGYRTVAAPSEGGRPLDLQITDATDGGAAIGTIIDGTTGSVVPVLYRPGLGFRAMHAGGSGGPALQGVPYRVNNRLEALIQVGGRSSVWVPCPSELRENPL